MCVIPAPNLLKSLPPKEKAKVKEKLKQHQTDLNEKIQKVNELIEAVAA